MPYIVFGCREAAWSEMPTSLATWCAPSHLPCQGYWKLDLHSIIVIPFFQKRTTDHLENSPALQAKASALSPSQLPWLDAARPAALSRGGCCVGLCPAPQSQGLAPRASLQLLVLSKAKAHVLPPHPRCPNSPPIAWHWWDSSHPAPPPWLTPPGLQVE